MRDPRVGAGDEGDRAEGMGHVPVDRVPGFQAGARGRPLLWNRDTERGDWGAPTRKAIVWKYGIQRTVSSEGGGVLEVALTFLRLRRMPDGGDATSRLSTPDRRGGGWWRMAWGLAGNLPGEAVGGSWRRS